MNDNLKKIFVCLCFDIVKNDKWSYDRTNLDYYKDKDYYSILEKKMEKLVQLLNEDDTKLLQMDIEDEIWDLI